MDQLGFLLYPLSSDCMPGSGTKCSRLALNLFDKHPFKPKMINLAHRLALSVFIFTGILEAEDRFCTTVGKFSMLTQPLHLYLHELS